MWRVEPRAILGWLAGDSLIALALTLWTFMLTPTPIFCTSSADPCSCSGGGFEIYSVFCAAAADSNVSVANLTAKAYEEYNAVPDFLAQNITSILLSFAVVIVVTMVYTVANLWLSLNAKTVAVEELQEKAQKLEQKAQEEKDFLNKKMKKMEAKWVLSCWSERERGKDRKKERDGDGDRDRDRDREKNHHPSPPPHPHPPKVHRRNELQATEL